MKVNGISHYGLDMDSFVFLANTVSHLIDAKSVIAFAVILQHEVR